MQKVPTNGKSQVNYWKKFRQFLKNEKYEVKLQYPAAWRLWYLRLGGFAWDFINSTIVLSLMTYPYKYACSDYLS